MAAHQELSKRPKSAKGAGTDNGGAGGGVRDDRLKRKCGTWNKSEVHGKYTYEVENAPEKYRYAHECSYCKTQ